jgi:hypothetical protein
MPKIARELSAAAVRKPRSGTKQSKPEAWQPVLVPAWGQAAEAKVM